MSAITLTFLLQSVFVYLIIFTFHALRRRITIAPLYVLLGGIGWIMYWITDAGVRITLFGTPVLVGSTVYFSAIIITVFIIYLFDEPEVTRRTVTIVIGIAIIVPITSAIIRSHSILDPGTTLSLIPIPHFRTNTASIFALIGDVVFLIFGWDLLSKRALHLPLWIRAFITLLAVMWLDVILYGTGAFYGTEFFWSHLKGTAIVRFWTVLAIFPFLWIYIVWQKSHYPLLDGEHTARHVFTGIASVEHELQHTRLTLEQQLKTEEKLRQSEQLKSAVIDNSPLGISIRDTHGTLLSANPAWQKIWNISDADLPSRFKPKQKLSFSENDSYLGAHLAEVQKVYTTGGAYFVPEVKPLVPKPGKAEWISQFFYAINNAAGKVDKIVILTEDISERKRAEQQLIEKELFLENITDVAYTTDREGNVTYVNPAAERLTGLPLGEIIGQPFLPLFIEADKNKAWSVYTQTLAGKNLSKVLTITTGVTCDFSSLPLKNSAGEIVGTFGIARDMTAAIQVQKRLAESEHKYAALVDQSPIAYEVYDENGLQLKVNPAYEKMWGMKAEDSEGKFNIITDPQVEILGLKSYVDRVYAGESVKLPEYEWDPKKSGFPGRARWLNTRIYPLKDENGAVRNVVITHEDISERKLAQEALLAGEQQHRMILQTALDGFWLTDTEGQLKEVNEGYCKMSGYTEQELLSMHVSELDASETVEDASTHIKRIVEKGEDRFEAIHRRKDGSLFDVEINTQYRPVDGGQIVVFLRDVTERKIARKERLKLESQLQQAQKMESIGRLAGGVAHDYNNMLGVIMGHAQLALERLDQKQAVQGDLEEILKASYRSADITKQLLTFARRQTIRPKALELNQVIEQMLQMLDRLIGENIELVWLPGKNMWPVKMDPSQLDQILANLCVNARDAITEVGKITIETDKVVLDESFCKTHAGATPGDYVQLSVSDDGSGMDFATLGQIFEPFFTTKKDGKGTGLGLATVYGIVRQNDGFIHAYSEPGQGTTFKIYFPRFFGQAEVQPKEQDTEVKSGNGERILLVEDEQAVRTLGEEMLKNLGYRVIPAGSPGEALKLASQTKDNIDLLITDVVMPEMNGRDFANRLLEQYPDIKVIFMSGYTANVIAHRGVLDDDVNFLQKPFSLRDLASKLRSVLDE